MKKYTFKSRCFFIFVLLLLANCKSQNSCPPGFSVSSSTCVVADASTVGDAELCLSSCPDAPHAKVACGDASVCDISCDSLFGDCDLNPATGCETSLQSIYHCGGCGVSCEREMFCDGAEGCKDLKEEVVVHFGSSENDLIDVVTVDDKDHVYVMGVFGENFDLGTEEMTAKDSSDLYVASFDSKGDFIWARDLGYSSLDERALGIRVAGSRVVASGYREIERENDPDEGEVFIQSLEANTGSYVWEKSLRGIEVAPRFSLAVHKSRIFFGGAVSEEEVDSVGCDDSKINTNDGARIILLSFDAGTGKCEEFLFSASEIVYLSSMFVDDKGGLYLVGKFSGQLKFGEVEITSIFEHDAFIVKFNDLMVLQWAKVIRSRGHLSLRSAGVMTPGEFVISIDARQTNIGGESLISNRGFAIYSEDGDFVRFISREDGYNVRFFPGNAFVFGSGTLFDTSFNDIWYASEYRTLRDVAQDSKNRLWVGGGFFGTKMYGGKEYVSKSDSYDAFLLRVNP